MNYSDQYKKAHIDEPANKILASEVNGKLRRAYGEITLGAELSNEDKIKFCRIPRSATLIDVRVVSADWGSTGEFDLGWQDSDGKSEEVSADGIIDGQDATSAFDGNMPGTADGYNKRFEKEVDIVMEAKADSTALDGEKISVEVFFVVE